MKLTIRAWLITIMSLLTLTVLTISASTLYNLENIHSESNDITENWLPSVRLLGEIKFTITRYRQEGGRYIMNDEPNELKSMVTSPGVV